MDKLTVTPLCILPANDNMIENQLRKESKNAKLPSIAEASSLLLIKEDTLPTPSSHDTTILEEMAKTASSPALQTFINDPCSIFEYRPPAVFITYLMDSIQHHDLESQKLILNHFIQLIQYKALTDQTYQQIWFYPNPDSPDIIYEQCYTAKTKQARLLELLTNQIEAIDEEQALRQEIQHYPAFKHFNPCDLWRLIINKEDHEKKGKYGYENQTGYLKGALRGFRYILSQVYSNKFQISWETLLKTHRLMTTEVENEHRCSINSIQALDSPIRSAFRLMVPRHATIAGIKEMLNEEVSQISTESSISHNMKYYTLLETKQEKQERRYLCHSRKDHTQENNIALIKELLFNLQSKLNKAKNAEEKELQISFCLANINRTHFFPDGNIRALAAFCIGIRLAYDLPPIIWDNSNILDGYSYQEIAAAQRQGAHNFQQKSFPKTHAIYRKSYN